MRLLGDDVDDGVNTSDALVIMLLELVTACCLVVINNDEKKRKKMSLLGPTKSVLKCGALI